MTDVASLVLQVDSSPAVTAATNLDKLALSGAAAGAAAEQLQKATSGVSSTMTGAATGTQALSAATAPATMAIGNLQRVTDMHSESLRGQRLVLRAISSDLAIFGNGVAQTAGLMGMLYIENMHILEGFGGLKNAVLGLITPTNLLIGGFAAVAVGGYAAYNSLKATGIELGNVSERTMTTVEALHSLESAAAFKGISSEDFFKNAEKFGTLTAEAKDNIGTMGELFRANNVAAGDFMQNFERAADLIANARNEADRYRLIQQLGLPPTREWVQLLSQGAEGIRRARAEVAGLNTTDLETLVARARRFDEAWSKGWTNFTTNAKGAALEAITWLDGVGDAVTRVMMKLPGIGAAVPTNLLKAAFAGNTSGTRFTSQTSTDQFYKGTGADTQSNPLKITVNPDALKQQIGIEQQRIGILGNLTINQPESP